MLVTHDLQKKTQIILPVPCIDRQCGLDSKSEKKPFASLFSVINFRIGMLTKYPLNWTTVGCKIGGGETKFEGGDGTHLILRPLLPDFGLQQADLRI